MLHVKHLNFQNLRSGLLICFCLFLNAQLSAQVLKSVVPCSGYCQIDFLFEVDSVKIIVSGQNGFQTSFLELVENSNLLWSIQGSHKVVDFENPQNKVAAVFHQGSNFIIRTIDFQGNPQDIAVVKEENEVLRYAGYENNYGGVTLVQFNRKLLGGGTYELSNHVTVLDAQGNAKHKFTYSGNGEIKSMHYLSNGNYAIELTDRIELYQPNQLLYSTINPFNQELLQGECVAFYDNYFLLGLVDFSAQQLSIEARDYTGAVLWTWNLSQVGFLGVQHYFIKKIAGRSEFVFAVAHANLGSGTFASESRVFIIDFKGNSIWEKNYQNFDISQICTSEKHFLFSNESSVYAEKFQLPPLKSNIVLFPNPVSSFASIQMPQELDAASTTLHVYNYSGNQVMTQAVFSRQSTVNFRNLMPGMYFILLVDQSGKTAVQKFLKVEE